MASGGDSADRDQRDCRIRLIGDAAPPVKPPAPAGSGRPRSAPAERPPPPPVQADRRADLPFRRRAKARTSWRSAGSFSRWRSFACRARRRPRSLRRSPAPTAPARRSRSSAWRRRVEQLAGSPDALARVVVAASTPPTAREAPVALASAAYAALDREPGGVDYSRPPRRHRPTPAAIRCGRRKRRPIATTRSSAGSKPNGRSATRPRPAAPACPTRSCSRRPAPASTSSPAPGAARSTRGCAASTSPEPTPARATAISSATWRAWAPAGRLGVGAARHLGLRRAAEALLWAIVAFALGFAVHLLHGRAGAAAIQVPSAGPAPMSPVRRRRRPTGSRPHGAWFETAAKILYVLGALALALNLWRAIGFASLLLRGAQLLNLDVRDRRRDLDSRVAAAQPAGGGAVRRRRGRGQARGGGGPPRRRQGADPRARDRTSSTRATATPPRRAASLRRLASGSGRGPRTGAPDRLVFVDRQSRRPAACGGDRLDRRGAERDRAPARSASWRSIPRALSSALGGPHRGAPPVRQMAAGRRQPARARGVDGERLVARLLATDGRADVARARSGGREGARRAAVERRSGAPRPRSRRSPPISPRAAKRFLNAYRLARCSDAPRPAVALMQAVAFADEEAQARDAQAADQRRRRSRAVRRPGGAGQGGQERARRQ